MSGVCDVLLVDDEPVVCDAIGRVLAHEGVRVTSVPSAEVALAHPALASFRLVICDLMLPGASGIELTRAIRTLHPRIPVMAISGYATRENAERAQAAGAIGFLAKPFDIPELLALVRKALGTTSAAGKEKES
jgi:two-component system, NtrC family, response regulator AtoC